MSGNSFPPPVNVPIRIRNKEGVDMTGAVTLESMFVGGRYPGQSYRFVDIATGQPKTGKWLKFTEDDSSRSKFHVHEAHKPDFKRLSCEPWTWEAVEDAVS